MTRYIEQIEQGDAVSAMEAAKALINASHGEASRDLLRIATNKSIRVGSRVAAVYALGLIGMTHQVGSSLMGLLADNSDAVEVRDHAAEALGNMRFRRALPTLIEVALHAKNNALKRSCEYAISEMD